MSSHRRFDVFKQFFADQSLSALAEFGGKTIPVSRLYEHERNTALCRLIAAATEIQDPVMKILLLGMLALLKEAPACDRFARRSNSRANPE
jgi:hypothetical protein